MRIISVVPSLTELLFDLGLESQIVGVTRFCIHPKEKTKKIKKIGGTKNLKIERIIELQPDLIIANKEENAKEDIQLLQQKCNVLLTDIFTLEDSLEVIKEIGELTSTKSQAEVLRNQINHAFNTMKIPSPLNGKTLAYVIWQNPVMIAGTNTFINDLITKLGFTNITKESRYPMINDEELNVLDPDYIFLSSEPFPFKEKQRAEFQKKHPNSRVVLVDGEMFSWYGSRLLLAPEYFQNLLFQLTK